MIEAKVICDSISLQGKRLTTVQCRYPKFIHGELLTHRQFSRNASSSRAIPVEKMIAEVRSDAERAAPVFWGKNQRGMSATEELSGMALSRVSGYPVPAKQEAQAAWKEAALFAATMAEHLVHVGAHKQIVNRILEPFLHINTLITATEWDNFFGLRLDAGAQPEMRALAEAIWQARKASMPRRLEPGQWHLPFAPDYWKAGGEDDVAILNYCKAHEEEDPTSLFIKVSVARCARLSYLSFETGRRSTVEEDLALYERLIVARPMHASPAEHQGTPTEPGPTAGSQGFCMDCGNPAWDYQEQCGNFVGWRQFRKMLPGEACAPLPEGYAK